MKDENTVHLTHSVPGLKMNGFDKPSLPYELWSFTASGWGTKVQINLANNEEKEVTLARFNPLAAKILALKGRIVGCRFHERGCSPTVDIQVSDAKGGLELREPLKAYTRKKEGRSEISEGARCYELG